MNIILLDIVPAEFSPFKTFWQYSVDDWFKKLNSSSQGLDEKFASLRLEDTRKHSHIKLRFHSYLRLFLSKFRSPVDILLVGVLIFSLYMGHIRDLIIVTLVMLLSGGISFLQELKSRHVIHKLNKLSALQCDIVRNGIEKVIPKNQIVPGDIIKFSAGDMIPCDCLIIDSTNLYTDESNLDGVVVPIRKNTGIMKIDTLLAKRTNSLWDGTSVVSGSCTALVINVGAHTLYGESSRSSKKITESVLDKGIANFGYFILKVAFIFSLVFFVCSLIFGRNIVDSILFAIALSGGIAPDLLPAIETLSLSVGANRLLKKKFLVKKLADLQILGEIDLLLMDVAGIISQSEDIHVRDMFQELKSLSVSHKIITASSKSDVLKIANDIGILNPIMLSGKEMLQISLENLNFRVKEVDIFYEVEPQQKEEIINALQENYKVGFLGNGINDVSAMKSADVGISVSDSCDVVREAADFLMMENDLNLVSLGIREGRKSYVNSMKYIFIRIGSNFGSMASIAVGAFIFPFSPMIPAQIFLMNFLSDIPYLSISSDYVYDEEITVQDKWDIKMVRNYMLTFGLFNCLFNLISFGILVSFISFTQIQFESSWFIQATLCELFIIFIIRSKKIVFKSKPSKHLTILGVIAFLGTTLFAYTPFASYFSIHTVPFHIFAYILVSIILYVISAEYLKRWFFNR